MQVEAEVVSNSRNKIHQTWDALFWRPLSLILMSEHLIKMAVFIISTLALHYIKDGERETLKCKASYPTAKIYLEGPNE